MKYSKVLLGLICTTFARVDAEQAPTAVVDDLGVEVALAQPPQRIVSLAPSTTELLFALELGDRVVGVTESCNYPAATASIAKVANFKSMSVELIVALAPDLVVSARGNDMEALRAVRAIGIPVFVLNVQTFDELYEALRRLGRLTGAGEKGGVVANQLQRREEAIVQRVASPSKRPRVMWGYWGEVVYTAGRGSFVDYVIDRAGGINVAGETDIAWPQVGMEAIVSWAPEIMLTTYLPAAEQAGTLDREVDRLQTIDGWKQLPAVIHRRIYYVEPDWLMRPGPRLVDALDQIAGLLHPEPAGGEE